MPKMKTMPSIPDVAAPPLPEEYPTLLLVLTTSSRALMMLLVDVGLFLGEQFTQNWTVPLFESSRTSLPHKTDVDD
jgi:hypothetical protein